MGLAAWRLPGDHFDAVGLTRRTGTEGLQLDLGGPGRGPWLDAAGTVDRLREDCARHGVKPLAVAANTLNDIGLHAPEGSQGALRTRRVLMRVLDTALALGAPLAFVPSFRRSAVNDLQDLRRTAAVLAWATREAEARGLLLASENALEPRLARALVGEVSEPSFRLLLDTYNPRAAGLDVLELIEATHAWIAPQVHLKDGVNGVVSQELLGEGDGRVGEALAALLAKGRVPDALILENDYRDGDMRRLVLDVERARAHAVGMETPGASQEELNCQPFHPRTKRPR
ncbi:sugar phosphate isomerase/epimerase [Streptomyces verrucosisporus]|uniref:sugar phosphate isomerase/epimerase family protein n=1 Tax=Streptomyces verrucosisporus TaxID=1695161 RepID=UPI0019D2BC9F|nr:TIM barrel protein [Streptomyces verrucosisporus]MBN3932891.1 sugar phosphate isomerase/epimerase [Streptomyces verrucosisporus]